MRSFSTLRFPSLALLAAALLAACDQTPSAPRALEGAGPLLVVNNSGPLDLGTLGGEKTFPADINNAGWVVGSSHLADGTQRAFLWRAGVGMQDLGTFGGSSSGASAVNDAGMVVGVAAAPGNVARTFRWTEAGGMEDIGSFSPQAVNESGQVAGWMWVGPGTKHAVRWTPGPGGGTLQDLGTLGGANSKAVDINDAGDVVGEAQNASGMYHAVRWPAGGGIQDLHPSSIKSSYGLAINNAGTVLLQEYAPVGGKHALLWKPGTGLVVLAGFNAPCYGGEHYGEDLNEQGQVLGDCSNSSTPHEWYPWVWTPGKGAVRLQGFGGNINTFRLSAAVAFNDVGQVLGGYDLRHHYVSPGTDPTLSFYLPRAALWNSVGNAPPTADPAGPYFAMPGAVIPFDGTGSSDPEGGALAYAWDFDGDGATDATGAQADHAYPTAGSHAARLIVTDDAGAADTSTAAVTVSASVSGISINGPYRGAEGAGILFSSAGSETADGGGPKWYRWTFGDGTQASSLYRTTPFSWTKVYADEGSYEVTLTVRDQATGTVRVARTTAAVAGVAPGGTLNAPTVVGEGAPLPVSLTAVTDPSSADRAAGYQFAFDCGNGVYSAWGPSPSTDCGHMYDDELPAPLALRVSVRDKDGLQREYTRSVSVVNAKPTIRFHQTAASGLGVTLSFRVDDPGVSDNVYLLVKWGDGTPTERLGPYTHDVTHAVEHFYAAAGSYTIYFYARDEDGANGAILSTTVNVP